MIGGGIFGVAASLELCAAGADVTLYERRTELLSGASGRNLFRLHRGYHYPRDRTTAEEARNGYDTFVQSFAGAVAARVPHHYAVAAEGSLTSADAFQKHCEVLGLRAVRAALPGLDTAAVEACFEVEEDYFDVAKLRALASESLSNAGVRLKLRSQEPADSIARGHDIVVVATYDSMNEVLAELGCPQRRLQYELCEVPVIYCPSLNRTSLVVIDGDYVSVAPFGANLHLLYDVENSVHVRVVADRCPQTAGWRQDPEGRGAYGGADSRFDAILASARRFLPSLEDAHHVGSLFSPRVVLPDVEGTDARPTLVDWAGPNVLTIFSGKVSASVLAGRAAAQAILNSHGQSGVFPGASSAERLVRRGNESG